MPFRTLITAPATITRLLYKRATNRIPSNPRRILLTRVQSLGDCVVFIPTITSLRRSFPDAEIHVLAGTIPGEAVFRMCPAVDYIHRTSWPGDRPVSEKVDEIRTLASYRFDAALISTEEVNSVQKMIAAGIPFIVGFRSVEHMGYRQTERLTFLMSKVLEQPEGMHEVQVNLQLVEAIGGDASFAAFDLKLPVSAEESITHLLAEHGLAHKGYVCVHAGTKQAFKRWSPESFAIACDTINQAGLEIVFIGTEGERELIQGIQAQMKQKSWDLSGKTDIPQLAVLLRESVCFLGNDSGPMHLGAAVGTPVVAIFTVSDPGQWGPWISPDRRRIFTSEFTDPAEVSRAVIELAQAQVAAS